MSKHTPGPWVVDAAQYGYIITAKGGAYDIAVVRDIGNEDNKANARLIAAAPELLAALKRATDLLARYDHDDAWRQARAAIAEAEQPAEQQLAQQAKPVQDQDVEDAIEAAYWQFDCRKNGLNEWASAPQSERDAFKAEARKLVRGYFPTRQAQDTKREMLAVADAFIRGKRAALTQQAEPVAFDPTEALRLADALEQQAAWKARYGPSELEELLPDSATLLRRQHAEIERLKAQRNALRAG